MTLSPLRLPVLRWIPRLRARRRLETRVGLWYHADYAAPGVSRHSRIPGIEPFRGEIILGQLVVERLLRQGQVRAPRPVPVRTLQLVHPPTYLESVTHPDTLARIFGLDTAAVDVDELLEAQRRAVGGTIAAALAVTRGPLRIGINLGGGFHHAEPERGGGFCVYNDIAVAIAVLRKKGFDAPIAVVDLDYHQGNGNLVAFAGDPTVLTYSLHGSVWDRIDAVANVDVLVPQGAGDRVYLERLQETLPAALEKHAPKLVFYLAGNDVLAGDRLGDMHLTPAGVLERDRRVIGWIQGLDARCVVTLGGGYSRQAWECTTNFVRWILTGQLRADAYLPARDRRRHFRRVAKTLDPYELQREQPDDDFALELEIMQELGGHSQARRFLDYYTVQGVEYALERYGLFDRLRAMGFTDIRLEGDLADRWRQVLRVHARRKGDPEGRYHLLVELVARRSKVPPPKGMEVGEPLEVLYVEWLLLQDPTARFEEGRPQLPGQEHPGLGIAGEILEALVQVCHRLGLDGLWHRPAHYHNALVGSRWFRFLDPEQAARFEAVRRVVAGLSLAQATQAIEAGRVRFADGERFTWQPADYVLPVSARLKAFLASSPYLECCGKRARDLLDAGLHLAPAGEASASPPDTPGLQGRG